ncbi:LacI family transcriptional regulator [Roseivivax sp. GX 12232]|uniref:LacI family DNA-binding transcriptional regulator n=1 Tax=Roseivivax sp. GX 12232 TaxID=2900547 RepID=UPI001E5E3E04|nr:LacI family transcriptional regulator [Roseivivax sp. GX 12232]
MATIYDVAKKAGVSPKTVSRVINGDAPVGPKTREAVEAAIRELEYRPSRAARTMRSSRSGLIGLITGAISRGDGASGPSGLPDLFIVQAIQRVVAEAGLTLMIADTGDEENRAGALIETFAQHRVEGLIYVADHHQRIETLDASGMPLVLANCFDDAGTPAVLPDDRAGQRALVERVIASGHRRIAYLTLTEGMIATELRSQGYREALEAAGIPYDPALVSEGFADHGKGPRPFIASALDRLLSLDDRPTVICCGNDELALRLYGELRDRGIRVPQEISVAGYDDYRVISETLYPPLTTADLNYHGIGEAAARRLLSLIAGEPASADVERIGGPVCWRQSVTQN